ncbi:helix-turn-helix domain-containing protein [Verrucomicrobiaceae bacterium N1E253]|uniref:Helix-turn-helix domain-containing protein n=1 Tax=Oceaniferula marina TaxID=2748318 RepID=A0A851GKW6_9BACT|nr:helix-turn-helix domain-containing protein [Oceaniferula marina]NWK56481.1 helix-turn-helix domain-containing protein [Oceaniferula marina]
MKKHQKSAKNEAEMNLDVGRFFQQSAYDDFDAFAESAIAWNLDFMQLDRGGFTGALQQCGHSEVLLGRAVFNRKLEQQGESPPGMKTFVIPVNRQLHMNWRRQDVGGNDLLVFPDGRDLKSVSNESFDIMTYSLNSDRWQELVEFHGAERLMRRLHDHEVISLRPDCCLRLRQMAFGVLQHVGECSDAFDQGGYDNVLEEGIAGELIRAILTSEGHDAPKPEPRVRTRALKKAREVIEEYAHMPISIRQLSQMAAVSERTLQYAFQDKFGVTPKSYLQSYRMNQVRKALRMADPDAARVVDVANVWGFWHMGQFAKDYRLTFSELPRETLKSR